MTMNRRDFLCGCATVALLEQPWSREVFSFGHAPQTLGVGLDATLVGKPSNLALFGEIQSWLSPEATPVLAKHFSPDGAGALRLAEVPWKDSEFDLGVEWPEFRTVNTLAVRFAAEDKAPRQGNLMVEFWEGITSRQGRWRTLEEDTILGIPPEIRGRTWTYTFPQRRTCRLRVRLQDAKQVEIESLEVLGPSKWKGGEVSIEWGHLEAEKTYDGSLSMYNGAVLEIRPFGGAQAAGPFGWTSVAGNGRTAGVVAEVLYTSGMDVDRTIVTVRTQAFDFSFLPGEAMEYEPIDIPDFGVYIRNHSLSLERDDHRQRHAKASRITAAVARYPEQTIENAYRAIRARRVTLSFLGMDSNNQKFGIAPDGHWVIGNNDPSYGHQMIPRHAMYFASTEESTMFQEPVNPEDLFVKEEEKRQELEEGWMPILTSKWSRNEVSFERLDYATLFPAPEPLDESQLMGNEPAVLISQLTIRNGSPMPKTVRYYLQPWKPISGNLDYGAKPGSAKNAWETVLREDYVLGADDKGEQTLGFVDVHGRGALALEAAANAVRYSVELNPGEEHVIHLVSPGFPLPEADRARLQDLPYEKLRAGVVKYWKGRLAEGMRIEIPDPRVQNLYNATLQHFLLVQTKDGKRQEYYPNTAMFYYGSIGSESSPIIQSLDMRGLHKRAESCLNAWLSTQGDSMPAGDYFSKEGGFFHFWPNYTVCQGGVLWALAEHYLYTRDRDWLRKVAPQIIAGCEFIARERKRTMKDLPGRRKPLYYGLAPAGCVADPRDWEYSFMLNAYFYLGLKKSAQVLQDVEPAKAREIAAEAADYLETIRKVLKECVAISPVTRLRDGTSVPTVPSYVGLRGLSTDVKDSVDPDLRHGYGYDSTIGPFHLVKGEVLEPNESEVTWMLNYFEDRLFMFTPLLSRLELGSLGSDWFNLGGFEKLQPYYVHYQDAYLQRDEIPNFLRGFFNTLASISDPQTLTFQEELDFGGAQPHKTHEEGWFFHQLRHLLVMETGNDLYLAKGTPRAWLEQGKKVVVSQAASYFGPLSYRLESFVEQGRIEARLEPPTRQRPVNLFLRLRHPRHAPMVRVTINGRPSKDFDASKEWIKLAAPAGEQKIVAYYS
jgi:hypothetical protein